MNNNQIMGGMMKAAFLCKITFLLLVIYIDLIYNLCIN